MKKMKAILTSLNFFEFLKIYKLRLSSEKSDDLALCSIELFSFTFSALNLKSKISDFGDLVIGESFLPLTI